MGRMNSVLRRELQQVGDQVDLSGDGEGTNISGA